MPRPGPRPYECVRRAWHSDRHQPLRGSLIQEIFRMANDVHTPATRSNREWLEKLPLVVLKAEEIMYSKANSEAEYMDLKTLWDRANEAIDTIIRRDDAPETPGDLLHPCIEAALNLGCFARRASRSQRHSNPGCYLSSIREGAQHLWPLTPLPSLSSQLESWYSAFVAANNKPMHFAIPDGSVEPPVSNCKPTVPSMDSMLSQGQDGVFGGRVYQLHHGSEPPTKALNPEGPTGNGMGLLHNFIGCEAAKGAENVAGMLFGGASENTPRSECDLSLRLGMFSPRSLDAECAWTREFDDASSCNGTTALNFESSFSYSKARGFDFINVDAAPVTTTTDEPFESCSSKWSSEEEGNGISRQCI